MSLAQLTRWWDSAWTRYGQRNSGFRGRTKRRTSFRPQLLALEDRCLLTTVTNLMDSGAGSLRQAIADTGTTGTVDFADGLHGTITLTSAPLTVNKVLTIASPGASVITVSGNHARQVLNIPAPFTVAISGLTIANGASTYGGGIFNGGALTITDCTLSSNNANHGGGIYNDGNLVAISSTFSGNSISPDYDGGGIDNNGTLIIDNSVFNGNRAISSLGRGGGIYNTGTVNRITNSTFSGNSAVIGGGIYNTGTVNNITNCTFSSNSATQKGGGIENNGSAALSIFRSTFSRNSAASSGGGIDNTSSSSSIAITNCTFNLNVAVNGAGISHTGTGMLTITNSTVSGNIASNQCGGIFHSSSGRIMLRNIIAAGNRAFTASVDVSGSVVSQGYNLIGNGTGSSGWAPSNGDMVGTADMPIDPRLGSLDDYGGPTKTMALLPGSPALNAGDANELGNPDQRGVVRSGGVNIGAYQASATVFDVAASDTAEAGAPFDVTVTAVDPLGQVAVGYTGTVTFSSADPYGATLPADYAFQPSDGGTVTFAAGAALYTAGAWDVTATDTDSGGITGSATVTITPAPAVAFQVVAPASAASGTPFDVTLIAQDPYGNTDTNYQGTVTWTSMDPDPGVVLPSNYTFQPSDAGQVTFAGGVTLITVGDQVITATNTTSGISGSATVTVSSPGLGLPESGRRAREDLRATMLEPMTRYESLTAAVVPPLLGSATSRGGRLESATVQGDLGLGSGFVPQRGDSFLILPAGAVDGLFATGDLDWALRRGLDDSADWTGAH